ncbi:MAG: M28 family peptidase [Vicinamibacterales bacterium]
MTRALVRLVRLAPFAAAKAPVATALAAVAVLGVAFAPVRAADTPQAAPAFDSARAWAHLEKMVAFGPRPAGSPAIEQTRDYIKAQIESFGLKVEEQAWTTPTPQGQVRMVNLVVRLAGRRPDRILLTGHYDTKPFKAFRFVGANDGGSSGAFLVELARVLKDRPREFTWELVWFDGEEAFCTNWDECTNNGSPDNTYGSRHYVDAARADGSLSSIKAMILVDMIAERNARFQREASSTKWLKDIIWNAARTVGHASYFPMSETPIEDDHYAFLEAGVPAADIIDLEYWSSTGQMYWHTALDTLDKLDREPLQAVGDTLVAALPLIEKHLMQ